jgi:hypothetical protein
VTCPRVGRSIRERTGSSRTSDPLVPADRREALAVILGCLP